MIGKTYYECGNPVIILARWDSRVKGAKRNVLILREDGSKVVRPFRGLRVASRFSPGCEAGN